MKKLVKIILLLALVVPSLAQEEQIKDPKARERIKAYEIAFITDRLGLTPEEAEKFWPIYREFSNKRTDLKQQFENARKNPDPKKTQEENEKQLIDFRLQLKQRELDLEKEYSGRILNTIPPQKLLALRKAEQDFRSLVIKQIQQRQLQEQRRQQLQERNDQRLRQRNN